MGGTQENAGQGGEAGGGFFGDTSEVLDNTYQNITACPECGSPNVNIQQAEPLEVETVTGHEQVEVGQIVCESVPPFELKHDLNSLPQDSPYLIRRRRIRVLILEQKFPNLKIRQEKSKSIPLQIEESLKRSSSDNRTGKDDNDEPTAEFIQVWLDPCMYPRQKAKDDIQSISGMVVPTGTLFTDIFPSGMYQCWIEGIDGVIELRDEHHKDYWVGAVYRPRAMSALGSDIEDIVEGNRQYNLMMSIVYTILRSSGLPTTLFDKRFFPNGLSAYIGSLQNMAAMEGQPISAGIHQLMPQPPTP